MSLPINRNREAAAGVNFLMRSSESRNSVAICVLSKKFCRSLFA